MFDQDNYFLVQTFEQLASLLPDATVEEAKRNNSYYHFHFRTAQQVIVPRSINFTFKYIHLINQHNPEYFARMQSGWNRVLPAEFGDALDLEQRALIINRFEQITRSDEFDIMPPIEYEDDNFIYYTNLEQQATPAQLTAVAAHRFSQLYAKTKEYTWRDGVRLYLFPVNDVSYYGFVNNEIKMLYPIWNSWRWSYEVPKYIMNGDTPERVFQFGKFDVQREQISIRMMNGNLPKELFV